MNGSPRVNKRRSKCKVKAPKDGYKQTVIDNYFQVRSRPRGNKANMSPEQTQTVLEALNRSQVSFISYGTVNIYTSPRESDNLMDQSTEVFEKRAELFSSASYFTRNPNNLASSTPIKSVATNNLHNAAPNNLNTTESTTQSKKLIQLHSNVIISPRTSGTSVNISNNEQNISGHAKKRKIAVESPKKNQSNQPLENSQSKVNKVKKVNMKPVNLMCTVVSEAIKHYKHVFEDEELRKLKHFCELEESYKYFIFKLFTHLPKWYNIYTFCERMSVCLDDTEVREMFVFFEENHYIIPMDYQNELLPDLLDLLTNKDLKDLCNTFKLANSSKKNKDVMKGVLLGMAETQRTIMPNRSSSDVLRKKMKSKLGCRIQLSSEFRKLLSYTYFLYTFTNSDFIEKETFFYQMLDENVTFPVNTVLESFIKVFNTRYDFLSYATAHELRIRLESIKSVNNKTEHYAEVYNIAEKSLNALKSLVRSNDNGDDIAPSDNRYPHLAYYTAKSQYVSILNISIDYLKSQHNLQNFLKKCLLYLLKLSEYKHYFGNWYSRLALILERHCSKYDQAAVILIEALQNKNDLTEIDLEEIAIRARRLKNKSSRISQGYHDALVQYLPDPPDKEPFPSSKVTAKPVRSDTKGRKRHYVRSNENGDKEFITVETVALNHYRSTGYPAGKHCEGSIISSIFCLVFWDIIYEKHVPGAFISKIQSYPLDFKTPYFYPNRRAEIDERLQQVAGEWSDEVFVEYITLNFNNHSHEKSICNISEDLSTLLDVINCIGREVLSKILGRLVKRFRRYHSGMPDLLVWNLQEKKCKFVEVKGEGDTLSIKQKFWLQYLRSIGAEIEVCQVQAVGY